MNHSQLWTSVLRIMGQLGQTLKVIAAKISAGTAWLLGFGGLQVDVESAEAQTPSMAPFEQVQLALELMTPRELVLMLHYLNQAGASYADPATRETLSLLLRDRLLSIECLPAEVRPGFGAA